MNYEAPNKFEKKLDAPLLRTVEGEPIVLSNKTNLDGFRVGDSLALKKKNPFENPNILRAVTDAHSWKVIGFDIENKVIIELNGDPRSLVREESAQVRESFDLSASKA